MKRIHKRIFPFLRPGSAGDGEGQSRFPRFTVGKPTLTYFLFILLSGRGWILLPNLCAAALHEAGHLIAMGLTGTEVRTVRITPFGAVMEKGRRLTSFSADLAVHAGGIAANLLSALCLLPFLGSGRAFTFFFCHLLLAALNLFPVRILDGGQVLHALLALKLPPDRADRVSAAVSAAALVLLWAISVYFLFFGAGDPSLFFLTVCLFLTVTEEK